VLSESSYITALSVYLGAAVVFLLVLIFWLRKSWRPAWLGLVVLLAAALLLTPAYPGPGVDTLAPALIVAGFQLATNGVDAAEHALRPLLGMCAVALVLALFLGMTLLRKRSHKKQAKQS